MGQSVPGWTQLLAGPSSQKPPCQAVEGSTVTRPGMRACTRCRLALASPRSAAFARVNSSNACVSSARSAQTRRLGRRSRARASARLDSRVLQRMSLPSPASWQFRTVARAPPPSPPRREAASYRHWCRRRRDRPAIRESATRAAPADRVACPRGECISIASRRNAMSSHGRTMRGAVAFTAPAKAITHCWNVALSGRYPTLERKRLLSASEFLGVSSETSKPAWTKAAGMRAVPIQRVAVDTNSIGMVMRDFTGGWLKLTTCGPRSVPPRAAARSPRSRRCAAGGEY